MIGVKKVKVLKTTSIILGLVIAFLAGYDKITENISDLTKITGIPIMLLLKLTGIALLLYWITLFLLKIFKKTKKKKSQRRYKTKKQQLNDKIIILNSIKKSDKWYLHCKYQDLNLREPELDKYIKILLKQKHIKPNGIFTIRSIIETPIYVITQKGLKFLNRHKNEI